MTSSGHPQSSGLKEIIANYRPVKIAYEGLALQEAKESFASPD